MANSEKLSKGLNDKTKRTIITTVIIAVLVLCVVGYFVYITGAIQRTLSGVKIVETVNEKQTTVESISILEVSYHYKSILNMYTSQGYNIDPEAIFDDATGKTIQDTLVESAAQELLDDVIIGRAAAADASFVSGADRYDEMSMETLYTSATRYGYQTTDQFLQAIYGGGMTLRQYRNFLARETVHDEYFYFLQQFILMPTADEIYAAYEADPDSYDKVDFNFYYYPAETNEDGTVNEDSLAECIEKAQSVADAATSSESFREAVMATLEEDESSLSAFDDDNDPTLCEAYTSTSAGYFAEGFTDFLFGETEDFETTVIETESGAYALMLVKRYQDETPTATYRTLTLSQEEGMTRDELMAEAQAIAAQITDELSFNNLVKANADLQEEILIGGYTTGVTAPEEPEETEGDEDTADTAATELSAQEQQLNAWLFDPVRTKGDVIIIPSDIGTSVTIYYFLDCSASWYCSARTNLINEAQTEWSNNIMLTNPTYLIDYKSIEAFL